MVFCLYKLIICEFWAVSRIVTAICFLTSVKYNQNCENGKVQHQNDSLFDEVLLQTAFKLGSVEVGKHVCLI